MAAPSIRDQRDEDDPFFYHLDLSHYQQDTLETQNIEDHIFKIGEAKLMSL